MTRSPISYVNSLDDYTIKITSYDRTMIRKLRKIGFAKHLVLTCKGSEDFFRKLGLIREMNIPFAVDYAFGVGYKITRSPSNEIKYLQEKKLFSGSYDIITWDSRDQCSIYTILENGEKKFKRTHLLSQNEIPDITDNSFFIRSMRSIFHAIYRLFGNFE